MGGGQWRRGAAAGKALCEEQHGLACKDGLVWPGHLHAAHAWQGSRAMRERAGSRQAWACAVGPASGGFGLNQVGAAEGALLGLYWAWMG